MEKSGVVNVWWHDKVDDDKSRVQEWKNGSMEMLR